MVFLPGFAFWAMFLFLALLEGTPYPDDVLENIVYFWGSL